MPTNIIAATPSVSVPRVAFPLTWLPVLLIVALGLCQLAMSLRYPEIASALGDIVGP